MVALNQEMRPEGAVAAAAAADNWLPRSTSMHSLARRCAHCTAPLLLATARLCVKTLCEDTVTGDLLPSHGRAKELTDRTRAMVEN